MLSMLPRCVIYDFAKPDLHATHERKTIARKEIAKPTSTGAKMEIWERLMPALIIQSSWSLAATFAKNKTIKLTANAQYERPHNQINVSARRHLRSCLCQSGLPS
jgi:hypothetical protein